MSKLPFTALFLGSTLSLLTACVSEAVQQNELGNELYTAAAYDKAIVTYKRAQVADPERAEPYYNAANGYYRTAQLDEGYAQAQQALRLGDPNLAALTWYNLGNGYFAATRWEAAINAYQEALRLAPNDQDAKHNLELALQRLQEEEQAEQSNDSSANSAENPPVEDSPTPEQQGENQQAQRGGSEQMADPTAESNSQRQQNQSDQPASDDVEQAQENPSQNPQSRDNQPAADGQESENQAQQVQEAVNSNETSGDEITTDMAAQQANPTAMPRIITGEMSTEQALQLLNALLSQSETLQEQLEREQNATEAPLNEDW